MLATSNSQERDQEEWENLFKAADSRYQLEEIKRPEGAKLDLVIFKWA
jgi:hypothetical protein